MAPLQRPTSSGQQQQQQQHAAPAGPEEAQQQDATLKSWVLQGYPLPSEEQSDSMAAVKAAYRPPRNDAKGIAIAVGLIATWAALFYHGCWHVRLTDGSAGPRSHVLDIVATFLLLEFVNTGLFITTHDAMHGTICYSNRRLNDWLGRVAITCYAYFDYNMLHKNHWEHHNHTGEPFKDPDFHRGNTNLLVWFAGFMWEYSTLLQFAKILLASQVLQLAGVPYANLCVYMAGAPICAAFRLFYFGTYLPHLPPDSKTVMTWQRSHSSDAPLWLTFLQCYHFGLHWEHHRWPYAPWFDLPKAKALTNEWKATHQLNGAQPQQQQQAQAATVAAQ